MDFPKASCKDTDLRFNLFCTEYISPISQSSPMKKLLAKDQILVSAMCVKDEKGKKNHVSSSFFKANGSILSHLLTNIGNPETEVVYRSHANLNVLT